MMSFQKTSCKFLVQFSTVILLIIVTGNKVTAQSMGISSSAITPDASSILEMRTSTKGLLMPRMTTTERDAIASPATGLIIYNTTTSKFNFYNGSSWITMFSGISVVNSVTGTSNRITIGGTAADPTVDISSSYLGQSSITTLGTIGTGVWNGTIITSAYGGTGNGFSKFSGATTSEKTYTLPDVSTTILTKNYTGALATGIVKNTTSTGELTIAVPADFPTLDQNTTGSAATLTTARNIYGNSFNGSADLTQVIASTFGGTGNGFTKFSGATTTEKTYTLPNANATILTDNATVTAAQGGTGNATYAVGDMLYASASTTLSKLAGVATGNALISGGVTTAPSWGKIGLTTHVSGTLPIANGGTNSSTALNNNRIMVSSGGTITEAAALTNGQLLIGSTSAAPVAATLTAGNGIAITNAAGAITIANEPTITMATGTSTLTTTSTTDVALSTALSITPGAGDYLVFFTGMVSNSNAGRGIIMSIFVNGTKVAASEIQSTSGVAGDRMSLATNTYVTGLGAGQAIEMRWRTESNTATIINRTLIVQKVK